MSAVPAVHALLLLVAAALIAAGVTVRIAGSAFRQGVWTGTLNPKVALFLLAFLGLRLAWPDRR